MKHLRLTLLISALVTLAGCAGNDQNLRSSTDSQASIAESFSTTDYYHVTAYGRSAQESADKALQKVAAMLRPPQERDSQAHSFDRLRMHFDEVGQWRRQGQSGYQALIVISRQGATDYLFQRLDSLDEQTRHTVDRLAESAEPLEQIGLLQSAIERQQLRAAYQKALKRIDPSREGRESPWDTRRWSMQLSELYRSLLINPQMQIAELNPQLKAGLKSSGLRPARTFEADYVLIGSLTKQPPYDAGTGYIQAEAELKFTLQHKESGKRYGDRTISLDAASLDAEEAGKRLEQKLGQLLKHDKREIIVEMAARAVE